MKPFVSLWGKQLKTTQMKTYFFIYLDEQGNELWMNAYKCNDDNEALKLSNELYMNTMPGDCDKVSFIKA